MTKLDQVSPNFEVPSLTNNYTNGFTVLFSKSNAITSAAPEQRRGAVLSCQQSKNRKQLPQAAVVRSMPTRSDSEHSFLMLFVEKKKKSITPAIDFGRTMETAGIECWNLIFFFFFSFGEKKTTKNDRFSRSWTGMKDGSLGTARFYDENLLQRFVEFYSRRSSSILAN